MNKHHKADEFGLQGSVPLYSSMLRAINWRSHPFPAVRRVFQFVVITVLTVMAGCSTGEVREITPDSAAVEGFRAVEDFYVVDCLLPGEVRQMGRMIYLSPRVPIKVTARDCQIRGGEYVLYSRANYQSALRVWMDQARSGDAEAQVIVGEIYERGLGIAPNYKEAANWYRKAAEQGDSQAQRHLGYLYEQGLGVEQDMLKALEWYRKSTGGQAEDLILASAAEEKLKKMRVQLESELQTANAQLEALETQITSLKAELKSRNAQRDAQQNEQNIKDKQTINALEQLLTKTQSRLKEKSAHLAQLNKVEIPSTSITRGPSSFGPAQWAGLNFGRYFALIIALEDYRYWDDLETPREDALALAEVLSEKYGFTARTVINADGYDILSALNDLQEKITENDNVLIYFAGHGQLRYPFKHQSQGYWLPVNAQKGRTAYWLPNSQINEQISMLGARSVLVIADSCYAGALSADPASLLMGGDLELTRPLVELGLNRRARYVLSAGGLHPVLDKGGKDHHSIFAAALLKTLESNNSLLREKDLLHRLRGGVIKQAASLGFEQRPELRPIRAAGHDPGGEFFLVPQDT